MNDRKNIEDMELKEMRDEISKYFDRYKEDEPFVFISYSHRDCKEVYRKVLQWMREGYNIFLDLDFERHGSDEGWVGQVQDKLRRNTCKLVICFRSIHYFYSYASMIELLTMLSKKTTFRRRGKQVAIDVIKISDSIDGKENIPEELKDEYKGYYERTKLEMGDSFCEKNDSEKEAIKEGLESWVNGLPEEKKNELSLKSWEEEWDMLDDNYKSGYAEFYPTLYYIIETWFSTQKLNSNYKGLGTDMSSRFNDLEIYKFVEAVDEKNKEKDVAKQENVQPNTLKRETFKTEISQNEITHTTMPSSTQDTNIPSSIPSRVSATPESPDGGHHTGGEVIDVNQELNKNDTGNGRKRRSSATGPITFSLYGRKYTDKNQGQMMLIFFEQVILRHQDKIDQVEAGIEHVSFKDYTEIKPKGDRKPSCFRSGDFLHFSEGKGLFVGTSLSDEAKMRDMYNLLEICGESRGVFTIEEK